MKKDAGDIGWTISASVDGIDRIARDDGLMKVSIFTTGTETVADMNEGVKIEDYFKGLFTPIRELAHRLRSQADVELHILSNEVGYVQGSEDVGEASSVTENAERRIRDTLVEAAETSEVMSLIFNNNTYECVVEPSWEKLLHSATHDILWCVSASPSVSERLDFSELPGDLLRYRRVGVARIDKTTAEDVIDHIETDQRKDGN